MAANDRAIVTSLGSGNVAIVSYQRADGTALKTSVSGHIDQYLSASCPAGTLEPNGGTIGDGSSGASSRH